MKNISGRAKPYILILPAIAGMEIFFWIAVFILFYTYLGYGLLLLLLTLFKHKAKQLPIEDLPAVTIIIPAYNEEACIEQKIENTLQLEYPKGKIFFLFISDGSTDATATIIKQFAQIKLLHQPLRQGKAAAVNRAMENVHTPLTVFTDANTFLHPKSIIRLAGHFADDRVGGVSGEKRIAADVHSTISTGERLYWQYESLLKKAAGYFYTIVGAAGELFCIRTPLFQPVDASVIMDDFVISARVCLQGYRFLYDSKAFCIEFSSASIREERKRKTRISAGCFQALFLLKQLLNPFHKPKVFFQYFSHKVLRWTACPLLLPLVFLLNGYLYRANPGSIYGPLFWLQCSFYALAFFGWALTNRLAGVKFFFIPYYFVFMIVSQYIGFFKFATNQQPAMWEKAQRKTFDTYKEFSAKNKNPGW